MYHMILLLIYVGSPLLCRYLGEFDKISLLTLSVPNRLDPRWKIESRPTKVSFFFSVKFRDHPSARVDLLLCVNHLCFPLGS